MKKRLSKNMNLKICFYSNNTNGENIELNILKKYFNNITLKNTFDNQLEQYDIVFLGSDVKEYTLLHTNNSETNFIVILNISDYKLIQKAYNQGACRVLVYDKKLNSFGNIKSIIYDTTEIIEEIKSNIKQKEKEEKNKARNEKRVNNIISHSDKLESKLRNLNAELDEYKNHLEQKVSDATAEIVALNKELEETQKEVVFTMGAIGESRSKETGNHVKRVAEYSYLLAKYYGLSEQESQMLKEASPMHDIGKVAILDAILNKPAKFTPEEFEVMKTHAQLGYDMLKHSNRPLLKMASIVAYEHHEKFDGNGYPRGLSGEDIHIYGRITAIADVFDALGSDRCYKKAWDDEKIFNLFKEERGKHFDPKLIDLFFENLDNFLNIRDEFKDKF